MLRPKRRSSPLSRSRWPGSLFIMMYLLWMFLGGLSALCRWKRPMAYTHPWSNWSMFTSSSGYHYDLAGYGLTKAGGRVILRLKDYFPMPKTWIDRGEGRAIIQAVWRQSNAKASPRRTSLAEALCTYLLRRHNQRTTNPAGQLSTIEVHLVWWPLKEGLAVRRQQLLTVCGGDE